MTVLHSGKNRHFVTCAVQTTSLPITQGSHVISLAGIEEYQTVLHSGKKPTRLLIQKSVTLLPLPQPTKTRHTVAPHSRTFRTRSTEWGTRFAFVKLARDPSTKSMYLSWWHRGEGKPELKRAWI